MLEGGEGRKDVTQHVYVPLVNAGHVEDEGRLGEFAASSEITAPGGEAESDGEQLFVVRMPESSPEQLRALGGLASAFGWGIEPVRAQEVVDADTDAPAIAAGAVAAVETPAEQSETTAYLKEFVKLKEKLDGVPTHRYAHSADGCKPYTDEEKQAFLAAGYRSVVKLTSSFGDEKATVYAYEDAPGLPQFKVTYESRESITKRRPLLLRTFTFDASGGTAAWQKYVYKSFGRVELAPLTEENQEPMDHSTLNRLSIMLFREDNFPLERVRNGTWERGGDS